MGVSDMMSVLMMVFLFIAILFMVQVEQNNADLEQQHRFIKSVVKAFDLSREELQQKVATQFTADIANWKAEVLPDGTIRFNDNESLFQVGSSELTKGFEDILQDFFPRYISLLYNSNLKDEISVIEIVGHTSSEWQGRGDPYLQNAKLSQQRAYKVMQYVYKLPKLKQYRPWLRKVLLANGASSSELISEKGIEDITKSKRVEFRTRIESENKLEKILQGVR